MTRNPEIVKNTDTPMNPPGTSPGRPDVAPAWNSTTSVTAIARRPSSDGVVAQSRAAWRPSLTSDAVMAIVSRANERRRTPAAPHRAVSTDAATRSGPGTRRSGYGRSRRTPSDDDALGDDHDEEPERGEQSLTAEGVGRDATRRARPAPQTQPISTALATVASDDRGGHRRLRRAQRDGGKGRGTGAGNERVAVAATIDDDQDDAASTPRSDASEGDVQGAAATVQRDRDGGRFVGRFDATNRWRCRRRASARRAIPWRPMRSTPVLYPSPSTTQHPSGTATPRRSDESATVR